MWRKWRGAFWSIPVGLAPLIAASYLLVACDNHPGPTELAPLADVLTWISSKAHLIVSLVPQDSDADLGALDDIVGSARLVGLGEGTHGSREFFTFKHRALEYLVEHRAFVGIAVEGSMPEAFAIDRYVRTGVGDPAVLLSHLYFWTLNTGEVLAMIQWMRSYDANLPAGEQIGFYGIDMQYPGTAIDSVEAFIGRVDPGLSGRVANDFACLGPYRNDSHGVFQADYSTAPASVRGPCDLGVSDVHTLLAQDSAELVASSAPTDVSLAIQMARLVEQWAQAATDAGARDRFMAENAEWLLERQAPAARLVLWAHNSHVSRRNRDGPALMGAYLAGALGESYRPIGFAFGGGGLNAMRQSPNGSGTLGLQSMMVPGPTAGSIESTFGRVMDRPFVIDLRTAPAGAPAAWVSSLSRTCWIGADFIPEDPASCLAVESPGTDFDAMIYVPRVTPSTLLEFRF